MKNMLRDYYEGKYVCCENSCNNETRSLHQPNKWVIPGCGAKLKAYKVGEKGVADTFNYLERLFDVDKKPKVAKEQQEQIESAVSQYTGVYNMLKKKVLGARAHNGYDKVDLHNVFSFMDTYNLAMQ